MGFSLNIDTYVYIYVVYEKVCFIGIKYNNLRLRRIKNIVARLNVFKIAPDKVYLLQQ